MGEKRNDGRTDGSIYIFESDLYVSSSELVDHYNNLNYHKAIDNVSPSDRFFGRDEEILEQRQWTEKETMLQRRNIYRLFLMSGLTEGFR